MIATIQFMSLNVRSSQPCEKWAHFISGDEMKAGHWRNVFNDHPEFFRKSPDNQDHYALIWRRASPRLYYRKEDRLLTTPEYDQLSAEERNSVSRVRVPETEIKTLIDIAIELHAKAREQHTDWRWWVPIVASFLGSLVAFLLGVAFGKWSFARNSCKCYSARLYGARRTPMITTIGARIKSLREQRKLSQEDLAEKFGFKDRQTLSAIETGERKVAADELLRAAQIFGVSIDYFTDPFMLAGEGSFSWRQTGVDGDRLRGYEESAGRLIAAFRTLARQTGREPPLIRPALSLSRQSSFDDASADGERFAAEFDLGDVPARRLADVMAEKLGILVLMVDPIEGVSGAACRLPELDVVLINRNEITGRRHFDLAHELFHILTWEKMPPEHIEEVMPKKRSRVEQLADNFASALLMPAAVLDRFGDWGNLTEEKLVDRLNEVADELLVTSQALRWRLVGMGRLSRVQSDAISDDGLRNNGRAKPGKPEAPPLFSKPFVQIVATALDEGQTSMRRIASILGLPIDDFAELFLSHGVEAPYEL